MLEFLQQPWHWAIAGGAVGLTVPALLLIGGHTFGISSSLRHMCAAIAPANIPFFQYNWKKEIWNLVFVVGIAIGAFIATTWLANPEPVAVAPALQAELATYGIAPETTNAIQPTAIFNFDVLFSLKGVLLFVVGGFLVGFGTRWAGGCTSGHAIMGLSNLQLPSLIATICFMIGGFIAANFITPLILQL